MVTINCTFLHDATNGLIFMTYPDTIGMWYKIEYLCVRFNSDRHLDSCAAEMTTIMYRKKFNKKLCLFYILILFLWGVLPGAVSAPEIAGVVCGSEECYVNQEAASISPVTKHFPAEEYLSVQDFGTQETMSAARNRNVRQVFRSVRHIVLHLSSNDLQSGTHSAFRQILQRETAPYCLCGIIITNYIHHQDGQKS